MRCRLRVKPNHRISSMSESWSLAGNEINFELVVATVIGMNYCLLLIMLAKFTKPNKPNKKTDNFISFTL